MAFISIIIPLFNKEKDIAKTLDSVFKQTYQNFEIVIVNDGSTDRSYEVVEEMNHPKIKLYSIDNNGAAHARNYAVSKANGTHVAFLDADDYWYPNHLEIISTLIELYPKNRWFATAYEIKHNKNLTLPISAPPMDLNENWMGEIANYFKDSKKDCLAWTSIVAMEKPFFSELNGFNTQFDTGQDIDLWIRAALVSKLAYCNTITATYNLLGTNRLTNVSTLKKRHMDLEQFHEYEAKDPYLKQYMDLNRYAYAIKFKMCYNNKTFRSHLENINLKNISYTKRFLLIQSPFTLILLKRIKLLLERVQIRIRTVK